MLSRPIWLVSSRLLNSWKLGIGPPVAGEGWFA